MPVRVVGAEEIKSHPRGSLLRAAYFSYASCANTSLSCCGFASRNLNVYSIQGSFLSVSYVQFTMRSASHKSWISPPSFTTSDGSSLNSGVVVGRVHHASILTPVHNGAFGH